MEEELKNEIESLKREIETLKNDLVNTKAVLENHTHSGDDGSNKYFNNDIELKAGSGINMGSFGFTERTLDVGGSETNYGYFISGDLAKGSGNTNNVTDGSQITIEHQPETNGSSNQTFFYGFRSPIYIGTLSSSVTSGGTTMSQTEFNWETNELDGAYVIVIDPSTNDYDGYEIASNTNTTLTITGGTWSFSGQKCSFVVFVPIYFGAAQYPWRRLYTMDGSGGGVRFGMGDTNGGQNALLYTDGTDLKFRKKDGTVTTVTVS